MSKRAPPPFFFFGGPYPPTPRRRHRKSPPPQNLRKSGEDPQPERPVNRIVPIVSTKLGGMVEARKKNQTITSEELHEFRELIRRKYSLDMEIWSNRNVPSWDRELYEHKMVMADAAMEKIKSIATTWDNPDYFKSGEDYEKMQLIRQRIMESQPRKWEENPPWKTTPHAPR